ncbi:MAG: TonB-dependent receptor [Bacteroidales bacterium]|nr:TonB-dependent receptor [Bacteroidales bacterium]
MTSRSLLWTILFVSFFLPVVAQQPDSSKIEPVYELGEVTIISEKTGSTIARSEALSKNRIDIAAAAIAQPSVNMVNYGSRNESGIMVRGFDSRAVPLFIDGMPVYIPYDGLIDLGRFKTFGFAKIDITKGMSSMMLGPNAMGGAINLVTLKPVEKFEAEAIFGAFSGEGWQYGLRVGSRLQKWYFQASYFHVEQKTFPLSDNFEPIRNEDGKNRENAYYSDDNLQFKVGFSPSKNSEYAININHQQGEKGNPPYSGNDPLNSARFWQWPQWNKSNIYFLSNHKITENLSIRTRVFYDNFINKLESYDDSTYSTQIKKYTFTSFYNDYDFGGNVVAEMRLGKRNRLHFSAHLKNDYHSEYNEGEEKRKTADQTISLGADHSLEVNDKVLIMTGLSYNIRQSLIAENYFPSNDSIGEFESYTGDAFNLQVGFHYYLTKQITVKAHIANRTRFATMKERYSYKSGRGLPNPGLKPEMATHYEASFLYHPKAKFSAQLALFYIHLSDAIQTVDEVQPGISQMQNTGKAAFKGVEMEVNYLVCKAFRMSANYSFIDRKNRTNSSLFFTDVPNHKLSGNLDYRLFKDLILNVFADYYSERFSTSYGTVAGAFATMNFSGSYRWKGMEIGAGINNIFDRNYQFSEGFPAAGRNYFVSLRYLFSTK